MAERKSHNVAKSRLKFCLQILPAKSRLHRNAAFTTSQKYMCHTVSMSAFSATVVSRSTYDHVGFELGTFRHRITTSFYGVRRFICMNLSVRSWRRRPWHRNCFCSDGWRDLKREFDSMNSMNRCRRCETPLLTQVSCVVVLAVVIALYVYVHADFRGSLISFARVDRRTSLESIFCTASYYQRIVSRNPKCSAFGMSFC